MSYLCKALNKKAINMSVGKEELVLSPAAPAPALCTHQSMNL